MHLVSWAAQAKAHAGRGQRADDEHQDKPPPAWSSARQANRHKTDEQRGYPDHLRKSRKARGSVTAPTVYGRFRLNRIGVSLASLSSVPVRPGTAVPGGSRVHFSGAVESHLPASGPTLECRCDTTSRDHRHHSG